MEIKKQVNTYYIIFKCDKCTEGEMIAGNLMNPSNEWKHFCNKCENIMWFNKRYPFYHYEIISEIKIPD